MRKLEITTLEEKLIRIRDQYRMDEYDRETIADAVNLIHHNEDILADGE